MEQGAFAKAMAMISTVSIHRARMSIPIPYAKLQNILHLHELWLQDDPRRAQADLAGEHLFMANLREANLVLANLRGANLTGAFLHKRDLYGTYMDEEDWEDIHRKATFVVRKK